MQLKLLSDLCLRCQAIHKTYKFYVYVADNEETELRVHSGKNAAVDRNLTESHEEFL